jgi:hypothetical protein
VAAAATEPRPKGRPSLWRWLRTRSTAQVSAAIAFIALLVGLAFNALSVSEQTRQARRQADQATEQRIAAEIGLLTQLNQQFTAVSQTLGQTRASEWFCDPAHGKRSLPTNDEAKLYGALNYYDYLAWLINNNRIRYDPARRYMRGEMLQTLRFGEWFFPPQQIADSFPELTRYRQATEPAWKVCA